MLRKIYLFLLVLIVISAGTAQASITFNFDDISISSLGWATLPTNYQGMNWNGGWEVEGQNGSSGWSVYGNSYNFPSLGNAAYNGSGANMVDLSGQLFTLDSLYVASWAQNDQFQSSSSQTLTVKGYLGATLVDTKTTNLSSNSFNLWIPGLSGPVDKIEFYSDSATSSRWWLVDNMTISIIPAPGAILLCSLGAGLVGWLRRRRTL